MIGVQLTNRTCCPYSTATTRSPLTFSDIDTTWCCNGDCRNCVYNHDTISYTTESDPNNKFNDKYLPKKKIRKKSNGYYINKENETKKRRKKNKEAKKNKIRNKK